MTDNVRKIFEILGVEPNEEFKIEYRNDFWKINEKLNLYYRQEQDDNGDYAYKFYYDNSLIIDLIKNPRLIIKLPKEPKKKKLRDLTPEEFDKWKDNGCTKNCDDCIFYNVYCYTEHCWVYHKNLYSDEFLDQEIEVEE